MFETQFPIFSQIASVKTISKPSLMRLSLTLLVALMVLTAADTSTHTYTNGEDVELWVDKVGLFHDSDFLY